MAFLQVFLTTVLVSSLAVVVEGARRLFFHPLAHIPGPRIAALTWWYEFYFDVIQPGKYIFKIKELHEQYGPIVRVTPDEIHINDVGFLDTIYAPATVSPRNKYDYQLRSLRLGGGVGTTVEHELHRKRREALAPFFSKRNVVFLEPLIKDKIQQLVNLLKKHATEKTPVNLSDAFYAFTNDIVNNFLFAHQTDTLTDEKLSAALRHNSFELMQGVHMNKHLPFIPDFLESLPHFISKPVMPPGLIDLLDLFDRVRAELRTILKTRASGVNGSQEPLGTTSKESVFHSILDNPDLPAAEKAFVRLEREGALLVLAGAESPSHSLAVVFYHLLAYPEILKKLRAELDTVPEDASWTQLEKLPYLSAVLEESHRIAFDLTARTARIAPETITYTPTSLAAPSPNHNKSYKIPAGTPMSTSVLFAHTAESVFPNPYVFDPDRWLGEDGKKLLKYQMAFGKGSRKCIGIELARAELFLVTAALVRGFDMKLWNTTDKEVAFVHDFHISMPSLNNKGVEVTTSVR